MSKQSDHHFIESSPVGMGLEGYEENEGEEWAPAAFGVTALPAFGLSPLHYVPQSSQSGIAWRGDLQ